MQQSEFLFFDEKTFDGLIHSIETCLHHNYLEEGILVSTLHVVVPTIGSVSKQTMTMVRKVMVPSGSLASNEMKNAARVAAREVKAIIEFKTEIAIVSFMDDETGPIAVGEDIYQIDRSRLIFPKVEDGILNCVWEKQ